jgi:hypothetical protein
VAPEELELRAARVGSEGQPRVPAFLPNRPGQVPDAKTMVRLGQLLEGPALRTVFERIVQLAVARRVTRGRKMRVDTTVVETPIRYPSDSHLCEDVARECVVRSTPAGYFADPPERTAFRRLVGNHDEASRVPAM